MPESEKQKPDPLSKSQRKRDMQALQNICAELLALSKSQLARVPLPDNILEAIVFARTLKMHGARKRHLQYIAKLMREVDPLPIQTALIKLKRSL